MKYSVILVVGWNGLKLPASNLAGKYLSIVNKNTRTTKQPLPCHSFWPKPFINLFILINALSDSFYQLTIKLVYKLADQEKLKKLKQIASRQNHSYDLHCYYSCLSLCFNFLNSKSFKNVNVWALIIFTLFP